MSAVSSEILLFTHTQTKQETMVEETKSELDKLVTHMRTLPAFKFKEVHPLTAKDMVLVDADKRSLFFWYSQLLISIGPAPRARSSSPNISIRSGATLIGRTRPTGRHCTFRLAEDTLTSSCFSSSTRPTSMP